MEIIVSIISIVFPALLVFSVWKMTYMWRHERNEDKETMAVMKKVISKKNEIIARQHELYESIR